MTLDSDDKRPFRGNNRTPMKKRTTIIVAIVAVAIIVFFVGNYIVSGGTLF